MPPRRRRRGRPPNTPEQNAVSKEKERVRRAKNVECECEFPDCSGWVPPTTAQRHLEYTMAQQVIREDLKGVEDLIAGYPPPHELWPGLGWQLDDESELEPEGNPEDPQDFGFEEDSGPDDPPDSPRSGSCVRVEVSRNYRPCTYACAHGLDLSAYRASGQGE